MTYNLTVSPDFAPDHISGWYFFNTWLQRSLDMAIHLELYDSFEAQREAMRAGTFDLIYANPYDASMLVRELGFQAVARPASQADETVIAVNAASAYQTVEDLKPGCRIATTDDPDVHTIGMIMLESADLDSGNTAIKQHSSYVVGAKSLLNDDADVGFFLKAAYDQLSALIRSRMRVLVRSEIGVVHHSLLVGPRMAACIPAIQTALLTMQDNEKGRRVLDSMGVSSWEPMNSEQTEFMIDLIDTLID
ncbi:phosphate/phosphite/phosphonate ABC transporter substrate-binding protein [Amphritea sp. 1_MG-2023]|uniref:phosphate/phosphite/phosphonate ABC transporter substrate-binding protein n=1 Tax=Amphritea sp. 1_MG-2023 TaxID=3062670 RepID=UPI0026E1E61E|nr:phosphate/phosphite/phosphonate ABC transporter substrate-binding protein [Amphritea sp. 1_MG-2023]MDO6563519.1 phosphate/phosphite/phosphonate ABC transporter substrate-binding protein [Amphritea sp. 1_MG-2023]